MNSYRMILALMLCAALCITGHMALALSEGTADDDRAFGSGIPVHEGSGQPADAQAEEGWVDATIAFCEEWVSLRAEPSKGAPKLTEIPLGARVSVIPSSGEFCRCRFRGMDGYVLKQYLMMEPYPTDGAEEAVASQTSQSAPAFVVPNVNEYLTLRNKGGGTISRIPVNERLEVLGWSGISCIVRRTENGQTGYVHTGYIKAENLDCSRWPYDYDTLQADLEQLATEDCPAVIESLTQTLDGREVYVVRYGDEAAPHHILIQCGIHAREIMTARLGGDLLQYLIQDFPSGAGLDDVCVHIVPLANPDGGIIAIYGQDHLNDKALAAQVGAWIGNGSHRNWKSNANGVDLNRNFDMGWQQLTGRRQGGSEYRGPHPHSEPETQALVAYTQRYPFDLTISIHSYGSLIYWQGAPDAIAPRTESLAKAASASTGYPLSVSESGLPKGGYRDWAIEKMQIPSLTIEIGAMDSIGSLEEYSTIALRFRSFIVDMINWVRQN